jgi:DNA-binding NtrC family response regulator
VDVRVVAASNRDLKEEMEAGRFREDLFYRLNVVHLTIPPLRQRQEDVPLLSAHFIQKYAAENVRGKLRVTPEALKLLIQYPWPGNVRELENSIEHAAVLAKGSQLEAWDLPSALQHPSSHFPPTMADQELNLLLNILDECGWNKKLAAQRLGISRSTVYSILKRHNISKPTTH